MKTLKTAVLLVACCLPTLAPNAFAGVQVDSYVIVNKNSDSSGSATGGMSTARNSADTNQYISCQVAGLRGQSAYVVCRASDANGNSGSCGSADPALVQVAASMTSDAVLQFIWDKDAQCIGLQVISSSSFAPKR
jgi:hypothetical protein